MRVRRVDVTFDVLASTDYISYQTSAFDAGVKWIFKDTELTDGTDGVKEEGAGEFYPAPKVRVRFRRLGKGDLRIECVAAAGMPVGTFTHNGNSRDLHEFALFTVHNTANMTNTIYPLVGSIVVGDALKAAALSDAPPILREGKVTPIGHSFLSDSRYQGDSVGLEMGDELTVDSRSPADGYGFLLIDQRPSMNTVYRAIGRVVRVDRFGGTGFDIDLSLISRVKNDAVLQGFWGAFIFITGLHFIKSAEKE
jgi:hypothetical protein